MRDLIANWTKYSWNSEVVIPSILKNRAVKRPRKGDIAIWYDKDSEDRFFHFAIYMGNYYVMKDGLGVAGPVYRASINRVNAEGKRKYQCFKIVRNFRMPYMVSGNRMTHNPHVTESKFYKKFSKLKGQRRIDKTVKLFNEVHTIAVKNRYQIPGSEHSQNIAWEEADDLERFIHQVTSY
jgi:hypothetical protein